MKLKCLIYSCFLIFFITVNVNGQNRHPKTSAKSTVAKGIVLDEKNQPVINAAVLVKGTKHGTITDLDGKFSLTNVKKGTVLEVSCISFVNKYVKWNGIPLKVILKEDKNLLNEVVVVGLGTQSRKTITASVSTVKSAAIQNRPVTDVTSVLQGNVPGLNFATSASEKSVAGGELGQDIKFNIRGIGSINGGSPYVLVDGVEQSLQNVNPADIESISVLKDASAAAIYGSRAAYGVVLVTTKSGKHNSFHLTYSGNVGFSSPINMPDMMNSLEYAKYKNYFNSINGLSEQFNSEYIEKIKAFMKHPYSKEYPGIDLNKEGTAFIGLQYANTDWFKYHFKKFSLRQEHNIGISGGTERTKYYVGIGFNDQNGLMNYVSDKLKKVNVNTKAAIDLSKEFTLEFNNNITYINIDRPLPDMTIVYHNIARSNPTRVTKLPLPGPYNIPSWNNLLKIRSVAYNEQRISDAMSMSFILKPIKDLKLVGQMNARFNFNKNNLDKSQPFVQRPDGFVLPITGAEQGYAPRGIDYQKFPWNSYARGNFNDYYLSPNVYGTYTLKLDKQDFKLLLGSQAEYFYSESLSAYKTGLLTSNVFSFVNANGSGDFTGARNHWTTLGYYTKFNYNYNDTYFLELSARLDGSSRFAPGHRWGLFPSMSMGMDIANLDKFKELDSPVNQLKLRLSYGRLGNQNGVGLYQYQSIVNLQSNPSRGWLLPGIGSIPEVGILAFTPKLPSYNLTWEKVDMANVGVDFAAFKDRLTMTLDVYQRDTRDMVGPAEVIPDISGINPDNRPKLNNANLRTRGFELSLSWSDEFKSGFRYSIGGNLSDYRSVITKYNNPDGIIKNNHTGLIRNRGYYKGMDIGEIWGYEANDLFKSNAEIDKYLSHTDLSFFTANTNLIEPGDLKYIDRNKDGKISPGKGTLNDHGDLTIIGNASPRFTFGLNFDMAYKAFEISALFQGVGLRQFPIAGSTYMFSRQENFFKEHLNFYSSANKNGFLPRPRLSNDDLYIMNTDYNTTRYLLDASYIRLKNLTVSYTFKSKQLSKIKLSSLKLYLSGENLFTYDHLPHSFDPETINQVNTWAGGSNNTAPGLTSPMRQNGNGKVYPLSKSFVLGINVTF